MSAMIGFVNTGQIERTTNRVTKRNSLLVIPFPKTNYFPLLGLFWVYWKLNLVQSRIKGQKVLEREESIRKTEKQEHDDEKCVPPYF